MGTILLIAYLSDMLSNNLNLLVYATMVKSGILSHYKNYGLGTRSFHMYSTPFFLRFLAATQHPAFILKETVGDVMYGYKTDPTLMRYYFILGIDQRM